MNVSQTKTPLAQTATDAVVIGIFAGEKNGKPILSKPAAEADRATDGLISKLIERQEINGKKYELTALLAPARTRPTPAGAPPSCCGPTPTAPTAGPTSASLSLWASTATPSGASAPRSPPRGSTPPCTRRRPRTASTVNSTAPRRRAWSP